MLTALSILMEVPVAAPTGQSAIDFTWLFVKMLFVLGIVSVLAVLTLKYAVPHLGIMKRFQKGSYFKVLGRYILEHRRSLYLVEAGGKYLVIGVSEGGVNLLCELTEKQALEGAKE